MCKTKELEQKQYEMVNKYQDKDVAQSRPYRCIAELYGLIIIAHSKGETKDRGSYIGCHQTGRRIDPAAIFEHVNSQTQQKAKKEEKRLICIKRIQNYKKNVQIRIDVSQEVDIVQ